MYFSHSPYRPPVLLASVLQLHTNFINKSIYNALEEAPIGTQAVKIFQTKQMVKQGLIEHSVNDGTAPALTKLRIFVLGFVYLTRWLLAQGMDLDHENGCSPAPAALYIDWSFSCGS